MTRSSSPGAIEPASTSISVYANVFKSAMSVFRRTMQVAEPHEDTETSEPDGSGGAIGEHAPGSVLGTVHLLVRMPWSTGSSRRIASPACMPSAPTV